MSNSFGPASPTLNPVDFDPVSGVAAVVHRGNANTYAQGSGELWWNYSTDMGMTWVRSTTSVQDQFTSQILARYPSMSIFNPTGSTNLADLWGAFAWPELDPDNAGSFGGLGYGVSIGMEASAFADIDQGPPLYSSNVPTFTDSSYIYWVSDNQDDASLRLFRTQDYSTVDQIDPPQWASSVFQDNGNVAMGGVCYNGKVYYAVMGSFYNATDSTANGWFPGYSVSTDNGSTWSDFVVADWRTVPDLAMYDEMWDWKKGDAFVSYSGDVNVDKNGMVHFVIGLTHYVDTTEYGQNAIVELYETSQNPSVWDYKMIADNLSDSSMYTTPNDAAGNAQDPAVGQDGPAPFIATNADRDFFVSQYIYKSPVDTTCDLYMVYRKMDADYSAPMNLTDSPDMNEDGGHLAPNIAVTETATERTYTAFSMYWYEAGNTGRLVNSLNPHVIYISAVPVFTEPITSVGNDLNNNFTYNLDQNYPNPFNPSTKISFTIAQRSNVTLKVYDMLGREVATLINSVQPAGSHSINFDASKLASGLYIYKITAGNFTASKKMMLLK
jgi:hypothetical protein